MSEAEETSSGLPKKDERHPMVIGISRDIRKLWRQDDKLLEKFFPIDPARSSVYQEACKKFYNERTKRWTKIPGMPKPVSSIYKPLARLLNGILSHYGISKYKRIFLDTHLRQQGTKNFSPSIFLSGVGPEFCNTGAVLPRIYYSSCISVFQFMLESEDLMAARDMLATISHRIFQYQDNRRFAFGLVITQHTFIVYMFDHAGAVASERCNYHENPEQFCTVISGLAAEGSRIGFDHTISFKHNMGILRTFESHDSNEARKVRYRLEKRIFQFHTLIGRGTMCWSASQLDNPEQKVVIKDAWIAESALEGRESEGALLQHAQRMGVTLGVAQIHHVEDVRRSADPSDLDTVLRNRMAEPSLATERILDRIHTRIVMKTRGKNLDAFSSKMEFMLAFHDAVLAHRNLHEVAGILHRDISVRNILINPGGVEGDRGILIDFDHAIRINNTSPYSTKTKIGTRRYMSRNVLDESGPHTYSDDLESFFFVLVWILVAYRGPGSIKSSLPQGVTLWDDPGASLIKYGVLTPKPVPRVDPWWGAPCLELVIRLRNFFVHRRALIGKPLSELQPPKDYDEYLGHIQKCITEMEEEDRLQAEAAQLSPKNDTEGAHSKEVEAPIEEAPCTDDFRTPSSGVTRRARERAAKAPPPILKLYPKRSTANYG